MTFPPQQAVNAATYGRLGSKKSSNGCTTCKIRKVKCDEAHPVCKRCTSTGRQCDGYTLQQSSNPRQTKPSNLMILQTPQTYTSLADEDLTTYAFFIREVIPSSAQVVDKDFWQQLLPQLCQQESVIMHAVTAMSTLIRYPQYSDRLELTPNLATKTIDKQYRRALKLYARSISGLQRMIERREPSLPVALVVTSILYICIECLQDNIAQVQTLCLKAIALLSSTEHLSYPVQAETATEKDLAKTGRAFLRHLIVSMGLPVPKVFNTDEHSIVPAGSLTQFREVLYVLISDTHQFVTFVEEIKLVSSKLWTPTTEITLTKERLEQRFRNLKVDIDRVSQNLVTSSDMEHEEQVHALLLAYNYYLVYICTCLSTFETACDPFTPVFSSMVEHARCIVNAATKSQSAFTFETRVIPLLVFIIYKCRHPVVRREALALLRLGPQVENVWKAKPRVALAEVRIAIEESGDLHGTYQAEPRSTEFPPESDRLYREKLVELQDADGRVQQWLNIGRWKQDENLEWYSTNEWRMV